MGIPGTAGSQATIMDGFPLSKKGMAARALSAAFCSSLMGGVFGALILSISIYYAIPIIMALVGEQFLLIILALLMVGALTGENFIKGVTACILGLIIGSIGSAPLQGDLRFTFGTLYLVEGVPIVIVGLGLFALPEIVGLLGDSKGAIAKALKNEEGWFRGIKDVFKNCFLVLRCSSIGCMVGALPGLGGTVVGLDCIQSFKTNIKGYFEHRKRRYKRCDSTKICKQC